LFRLFSKVSLSCCFPWSWIIQKLKEVSVVNRRSSRERGTESGESRALGRILSAGRKPHLCTSGWCDIFLGKLQGPQCPMVEPCQLSTMPVALNRGYLPTKGHQQCLEMVLVVTLGRESFPSGS
jgi:hypothetical protein